MAPHELVCARVRARVASIISIHIEDDEQAQLKRRPLPMIMP